MKKRDYKLFIKDIVDAMEHIEEFTVDMALEELEADEWVSNRIVIERLDRLKEGARYNQNLAEIKKFKITIDEDKLLHQWEDGEKLIDKINKLIKDKDYPFGVEVIRGIS